MGIGTANPTNATLDVVGDIAFNGGDLIDSAGTNAVLKLRGTDSTRYLELRTGSSMVQLRAFGSAVNELRMGAGTADHLTITSSGNVGIGTTTPNNKLDIYSTTKSAIGFSGASGDTYKWTIGMDVTNGGRFSIASSTALGTTDRLVIDGNGSVGVGTSSPSQQLSIQGNTYLTGGLGVGRATTTSGVIETTGVINVQGAGTSSFTNGINLADGCFSTRGTCAALGGTTINSGTANRLAYYSGASTLDSANYLTTDATNFRLGIGTTSPATTFSVAGNTYLDSNVITISSSSAATTTVVLGNGLNFDSNTFVIDPNSNRVGIGTTSPAKLLSVSGSSGFMLTNTGANHTFYIEDIAGDSTPFVIDESGNVGIGTAAPGYKLDVNSGTTDFVANFESTDDQIGLLLSDGDDFLVGIKGTSFFIDRTTSFTSPDDFVLDNNGNVGIGTTTPAAKLSINAASNALGFYLAGYANNTADMFRISTSTASATSTAFIIDANGKVGIGTSSPSQQLSISGNAYLTGGLGVGIATTTSGVIETTGVINVQGAGTSSFTNGINLADGCFATRGTCAALGGTTINSGTANRLA
ncbi:MAG: putative hemagluttinin, partial [Parcubacteria group bacterium GW2011_GWB1_50_9]